MGNLKLRSNLVARLFEYETHICVLRYHSVCQGELIAYKTAASREVAQQRHKAARNLLGLLLYARTRYLCIQVRTLIHHLPIT
jgi:hypothetical protein